MRYKLNIQKTFCVYTLAYPNGDIFYIGKGRANRLYAHDSEARIGRCTCRKCRAIQGIWERGEQVQVAVVFETDDSDEAFCYERNLIHRHIDGGKLCNVTGVPANMDDELLPVVEHELAQRYAETDVAYYSANRILAEIQTISARAKILLPELRRARRRLERSAKRLCDALDAI